MTFPSYTSNYITGVLSISLTILILKLFPPQKVGIGVFDLNKVSSFYNAKILPKHKDTIPEDVFLNTFQKTLQSWSKEKGIVILKKSSVIEGGIDLTDFMLEETLRGISPNG